jgi:uncharacterized protein
MDTDHKYNSLKNTLRTLKKVVIAYSGGVDSTFLLKVAVDVLGSENVVCCLGVSASLAESQKQTALEMAEVIGVVVRQVTVSELEDASYSANKADRCFHCKSHLFGLLRKIADDEGIENVICGSNFDDLDDYRPGNRAAKALDVTAPLMEAELTKDEIRQLSAQLGLKTAKMPATPCLASRVSYGVEITEQKLKQIDQAEDYLRTLGFVEFRVRHHDNTARIEVHEEDIPKVIQHKNEILSKLKSIGFKYIALDLQGFRSGSLNESLSEQEKQQNNR